MWNVVLVENEVYHTYIGTCRTEVFSQTHNIEPYFVLKVGKTESCKMYTGFHSVKYCVDY